MRRLATALTVCLTGWCSPAPAETTHRILKFDDLSDWTEDDHAVALSVFVSTCRDMRSPDWRAICALASSERVSPRMFFERFFRPVVIEDGEPMVFTGYYEPELRGSRQPGGRYRYPIYRLPEEARDGAWHSRSEIEEGGLLDGRGLEIAWIDDPLDVFFLQIQGSGRVRFQDGTVLRVGYAGKNGHDYRSLGLELVRRGEIEHHEASIDVIRGWIARNGEEGRKLLHHSPSYVFFREVSHVPPDRGPLGAMNRSVTAMRSVAVDPAHVALGTPVWIEKDGAEPLHRLMVAQDTGSAIKGAQRADIFVGTGSAAGEAAARIRDPGRMVVLVPIQRAYALGTGF